MLIRSNCVNIQVLGSDGGRESGKGDELVLHFDCVVDAVYVEEVDDKTSQDYEKIDNDNERESWSEDS